METKNKKIIISIIAIFLIGIGLYFYFSKKVAPIPARNVTFPGDSMPLTGFTNTKNGDTTPNVPTFTPGSNIALPRLYELHNAPVAGVGFIEDGKGSNRAFTARYIERGLGHIFEAPLSTLIESRIVNETRSRLMEALWGNGGKSVVIRFMEEKDGVSIIKTSILNIGNSNIPFNSGTSTVSTSNFAKTEEVFLPDYIPFMANAEDNTDKIFYLENGIGSSVGSLSTFKNIGATTIFSSAFNEWLPQFPNQKLITLTTKPSATIAGHLFFVDTKTKAVTKVLGGINGLTTLTSHDGSFVLFSETDNDVPNLYLYDVAKKTKTPLLLQTLPEKCVWGFKKITTIYCAVPQNIIRATYPDQWYQGIITFSDELWEIDATNGNIQKIMTPGVFGASSIDIINPTLSSDDGYILFMNKFTGTPWFYRIIDSPTPSISTMNTVSSTPISTTTKNSLLPPDGMVKIK